MTQFFKTREETQAWLEKMNIQRYTINDDLTVDVDDDIDISEKNLDYIPVQFGHCKGDFQCFHNNLSDLVGSPYEVEGDFQCQNNQLTTLKGSPEEIGDGFYCSGNKITNLEGSPICIAGSFYCSDNEITSLKGNLKQVGYYFNCSNNPITIEKYVETIKEIEIYDENDVESDFSIEQIRSYKENKELNKTVEKHLDKKPLKNKNRKIL